MSPAHRRGRGRWLVVGAVVVVVAGLAVATRTPGVAPLGGPPVAPAAFVTTGGAESSAWYCTGQSTAEGKVAGGVLVLTNTTGHDIAGTVSTVDDLGATARSQVTVPAHSQLVPSLTPPGGGSWLAQTVVLNGGGVAVTQLVASSAGWSEVPCASRTSPQWYFPSGTTAGSNGMFLSMYNPTSSPDVVDLTFVTAGGVDHPINFQGVVLQPGAVQVANVSAFVQDQPAVATIVTARTGRVVASEVQQQGGGATGLSIVPGEPAVQRDWSIPQSDEGAGASALDIFNPGQTTETVTVSPRLASGPVASLQQKVLPLTTWVLVTSAQTRLPHGDNYSTVVAATGGSGVVVGRVVVGATSAPPPQAGLSTAVGGLTSSWPTHQWVVPSPGSTAMPAYSGALPEHLALANPGHGAVHYTVLVMTPRRTRVITSGTLQSQQGLSIGGATLFGAGLYPLLVRADGPLSVSEDVGPNGAFDAITMPGITMASAG